MSRGKFTFDIAELLEKHKDLLDSRHIKDGFLVFDKITFDTGKMEVRLLSGKEVLYLIPIDGTFTIGDSLNFELTQGTMKVTVRYE